MIDKNKIQSMLESDELQSLLEDKKLQTLIVRYVNYYAYERSYARHPMVFKTWIDTPPKGLITQLETISICGQPNSIIKAKAIDFSKLYLSAINNEIDKIKLEVEDEFKDAKRLNELVDKIKMILK